MTDRMPIRNSMPDGEMEHSEHLAETDLHGFKRDVDKLESMTAKVVVGQGNVIREIITAIFSGGHVLLEGVPGLGKTMMVRSLGTALGMDFTRIQCTPDMIPADITGTNVLLGDEAGTRGVHFQQGPIFSRILLADEINRATPKTQSAFLEAMEEHQVTVGGKTHPLPEPFTVLATQNPIEIEGTFPLPEAQLDRFMFNVVVDYPDRDELLQIARSTTGPDDVELAPVLSPERVLDMRRIVRRIPVSTDILEKAVSIVRATHPRDEEATEFVRKYVRFGASPRAVQTLIIGAKFHAILAGRCHVAPADLGAVAHPAMRHRVLLNFEASANSIGSDEIIGRLVEDHLQ